MKRVMSVMGLAAMTFALSAPGRAQDPSSRTTTTETQTTTVETKTEGDRSSQGSPKDATSAIQQWPENSKLTARQLIDKYGPPDAVTGDTLVWNEKDQWSQVTVYREGPKADFPVEHENIVENTIHYDVPLEGDDRLTQFDPSLMVHRETGTLSARSDSERANILALNLADEILRGKRSVDDARDFMRKTLNESMSGKSSPYEEHLLFSVDRSSGTR